ncbi:MAG TPA: 2OG-Fe(II) oxygenase [Terriglobales bacterium]|nr:2OG-Fe(II) oxygenase [Terriglobales bacterium]
MMPQTISRRLQALDWDGVQQSLSSDGYAVTPKLLGAAECSELMSLYEHEEHFRSRIVMARFGFGSGEYKYFNYPLPQLISQIREEAYPKLANIANLWAEQVGGPSFPKSLAEFLNTCHKAGQRRATPLLLRYGPGDFNCLHQDLYGEIAFPFQMTVFLSKPGEDYSGGEFVLVEQRPRMQSRACVLVPEQGQAVIFHTRYRPVRGSRGFYRANLKHGVSPVRSGLRFTLGIIFHDAK